MEPMIISAAFSEIKSQLASVIGPAPAAGYSVMRAQAGLSDQAVARAAEYYGQRQSVKGRGTKGYASVIPDPHRLIELYHQGMGFAAQGMLQNFGIDVSIPNGAPGTGESDAWANIITFAAAAAPLEAALMSARRAGPALEGERNAAATELDFHFRRAGISRPEDRNLITRPYHHWSAQDAQRLVWMGLADAREYSALTSAAGYVVQSDADYVYFLSQYYPNPDEVAEWDTRGLFDAAAGGDMFGLLGTGGTVLGSYYAGLHGVGKIQTRLPDEPAGAPNWYDLKVMAGRPLPGYGEMRAMAHRLRPAAPGAQQSVVKNAQVWGEAETRAALKLHGYADSIVDRFVGLLPEPINIRIINHILTETLKHPALAAQAQAVMGEGVDWVKNAFLDHGFTDPVATITANAVRQAAWDSANAEQLEVKKAIRAENRRAMLEQYELGIRATDNALLGLQDEFVDGDMARQLLEQVDDKIRTDFVVKATAEIKGAFMEGKLSVEQVGGQLSTLGVNPARQAYYMQEWMWARNDKQRVLATGEILMALRKGLMNADRALARLVNLGWTAPDAMVEVAIVENDLQESQMRAAETETAKAIAEQQRADREAALEVKRAELEQAKLLKEQAKSLQEADRIPFEQAAGINRYAAEALHQLGLYNKAKAKNNQDAMDEAIDKAAAAYDDLLLQELHGEQLHPEVTSGIEEIIPVAIPQPASGQKPAAPASGSPQQPDGTPAPGGGPGPAPGP